MINSMDIIFFENIVSENIKMIMEKNGDQRMTLFLKLSMNIFSGNLKAG